MKTNTAKMLVGVLAMAVCLGWTTQAQAEGTSWTQPRTFSEAMPVLKQGMFESDNAYLKRAEAEIQPVMEAMFPASQGYNIKLKHVTCSPATDLWARFGVSGQARWEYDGWIYFVEMHACDKDEPLNFTGISIEPAGKDEQLSGRMPATNQEFVQLVNKITRMRIDDAEEYEFIGWREFSKSIDIEPDVRPSAEVMTAHRHQRDEINHVHSHCYGDYDVKVPNDPGHLELRHLENADIRYFPRLLELRSETRPRGE